MSILTELGARRVQLLRDAAAIAEAIRELTPLLNGGQNGAAKTATTNSNGAKTPRHRAKISEGMKAAWARRKAAQSTTSTQETQ